MERHSSSFLRISGLGLPALPLKSKLGITDAAAADDDATHSSTSSSGSMIGAPPPPSQIDYLGKGGWQAGRLEGFPLSEAQGGGSSTVPLASEWETKSELTVASLQVQKTRGRRVVLTLNHGGSREVKFDTEVAAEGFVRILAFLKAGEAERMARRRKAAMAGLGIKDEDAPLNLLVEIVSGWDLLASDYLGSDPYVKVYLGKQTVHRTKHLTRTTSPIYTIKTKSVFVLTTTARKLFDAQNGMKFEVKDFDLAGRNDILGSAFVSSIEAYKGKGERMILPLYGEKGSAQGFLAVRFRHATEKDLEFMTKLNTRGIDGLAGEKNPALETAGGKRDITSILSRHTKKERSKELASLPGDKVKYCKVRPCPDPTRPKATKWMTAPQIQGECMQRSRTWLDAGTGNLAKIYLEIIGCDGLPNLDTGGLAGNKTDSYVTAVFEDVVVRTDVIVDRLSPRWLPWTKRAFIFRMMHPSSQIHLGVFDHDNGYDDHDSIGRASVDLSTFRPYTSYILHYNLYNTDDWTKREPRGTITIRLALEIEDERRLILAALQPAPTFHINICEKKDFHVARFTATGQKGAKAYGLTQIFDQIDELNSTYQRTMFYLRDSMSNIIFWRSTYLVDIGPYGVKLPLRSVVFFTAAITFVEMPHYLLSFILGSIGFTLMGTLSRRRSNPSQWLRARTYHYYWRVLLRSRSASPPLNIKPNQNKDEYEAWERDWTERQKEYQEATEAAAAKNLKMQEELQKELAEIGDADISTKSGGGVLSKIDPFQGWYIWIQTILEYIITITRFCRWVALWEENYLAFWLTTASFVLAIVCAFIPWGFIILWTMRILVWTFLGPWMKIADLCWDSHFKPFFKNMAKQTEKGQQEAIYQQKMLARIAREDGVKLKVLKQAMFGRYISNVPVHKTSRYQDAPLIASEAHPIAASTINAEKATWVINRMSGQQLFGEMIPLTDEPSGDNGDISLELRDDPTQEDTAKGESQPLLNGNGMTKVKYSDHV